MKKKSLKLDDLKVQSFVTSLNERGQQTVKAGGVSDNPVCQTAVAACDSHAAACENTANDMVCSCPNSNCGCVRTLVGPDGQNICYPCTCDC